MPPASAGSACAYVSREIPPAPGYLVGWSMIFDSLMKPIICVIRRREAARNILLLPFWVFAVWFALLVTVMNLRGIEARSRTNAVLVARLVRLALGVLYGGWRTSCFRGPMDFASMASEEEPVPGARILGPVNR